MSSYYIVRKTLSQTVREKFLVHGARNFSLTDGPDWYLNKVTLRVTDVNDNVPEWSMEPHPYLAVVSPEAGPGTLVYQLQARDGDQGEGGEVEYFLSDAHINLGPLNPPLPLRGPELGPCGHHGAAWSPRGPRGHHGGPPGTAGYLLSVWAVDGLGGRSVSAAVPVAAGPRAPQFTNSTYSVSIPENTPEGQP
ncbi:hypothetical protein NHX12_003473, partial [Muraenolepis orangiensis]